MRKTPIETHGPISHVEKLVNDLVYTISEVVCCLCKVSASSGVASHSIISLSIWSGPAWIIESTHIEAQIPCRDHRNRSISEVIQTEDSGIILLRDTFFEEGGIREVCRLLGLLGCIVANAV